MHRFNAWKRACTTLAACSVAFGVAHVPAATAQDTTPPTGSTEEFVQHYKNMQSYTVPVAEQVASSVIIEFQKNMAGFDNPDPAKVDALKSKTLSRLMAEFNAEARAEVGETWVDVQAVRHRENWEARSVIDLVPPVPAAMVPKLTGFLEGKAEIHKADLNARLYPMAPPNDPDYNRQWPYHSHALSPANSNAKVDKAWDLGYTGEGVIVGVSDSGIINHPEMQTSLNRLEQRPFGPAGNPDDKLINGIDLVSRADMSRDQMWTSQTNDRDLNPYDEGDWVGANDLLCPGRPSDSSFHGTHVSGIIAATQDNNAGGSGTAPNAKLLMARSLGHCGGQTSDIADAIAWLGGVPVPGVPDNQTPAKVINLSLGGEYPLAQCEPAYQRVIDAVHARGVTVLVAAGNDTQDMSRITPANCNNVITIGATGPEGHRAMYSNFGRGIDLGSPGGNLAAVVGTGASAQIVPTDSHQFWSTVDIGRTTPRGAGYGYMEGTSMATPLASGVVAMMLEANPNLTPDRIEEILKETAQPYTTEPNIADTFNIFPDRRRLYDSSRTRTGMGAGVIDACAAVYQAAIEGGVTPPVDCDGVANATATATTTAPQATVTVTAPGTTVTAPASTVVTTVETTVTAAPVTETKIETTTATVESTVNVPGEPVTITQTTTETAAPTTETVTEKAPTATTTVTAVEPAVTTTTTLPQDTTTVTQSAAPTTVVKTETTTAPAADPVTVTQVVPTTINGEPTTITETTTLAPVTTTNVITETEPAVTDVTTVTEVAAPVTTTEYKTVTETPATATVTETTTSVVNQVGEPVTEVSITTQTETTTVAVPVTTTSTVAPVTTTVTTTPAPKQVATITGSWWPALLAIPVALISALAIPGVQQVLAPFTGDLNRANLDIQRRLGIFNPDTAKRISTVANGVNASDVFVGSSLINLGLILSSLAVTFSK